MAQIVGGFQASLLLAAAGAHFLRSGRRLPLFRYAALCLCAGAAAIPVHGLPLSGYMLGICGELSVTSLFLLMCVLLGQLTAASESWKADMKPVLIAVALAGLLLYPASTGLLPMDPYRLGYRPAAMLIVLAALACWAWMAGRRAAALVPLLAVAAFDFRLLESCNLWDYLIDPFVTICAWAWMLWCAARGRSRGGES